MATLKALLAKFGLENLGSTTFSGVDTPTQLTVDQIDYAIAANATVLRLSSDRPVWIRSIAGGTAGRYLTVSNVGTSLLILPDEDLLAPTVANRIATPGDIILFPDQSLTLLYDGVSSRWRSPNSVKEWKRKAIWAANGNSTVISLLECAALTAVGTATAANAAASAIGQYRRIEYLVGTAATNAIASIRAPAALWWRGNAAGLGGFNMNMRWGPATGGTNTSQRAFAGLDGLTSAPTDVEPSSILNIIGMGWDAADANVQIMSNDGSGTATKTNLGANFVVPTTDRGAFYDLQLLALPNVSSVYYKVTSLLTGAIASGAIVTDLPANTTFLAPRAWVSVGGVSSVVGITFSQCTIESDY